MTAGSREELLEKLEIAEQAVAVPA
jgi:hypothetical protein